KRYFEGKGDARDVAMVQAWLQENPSKWREYIGAEEWENFQPAQDLSPDVSGKLWNNIHKNTGSTSTHYSWFRWAAVAASVLLVVGLSWYFISNKREGGAAVVAAAKNISNNTSQKMVLTLSDGTTVELSPNSTLSYPENFNASKRAVTLNGEAIFTVAKD